MTVYVCNRRMVAETEQGLDEALVRLKASIKRLRHTPVRHAVLTERQAATAAGFALVLGDRAMRRVERRLARRRVEPHWWVWANGAALAIVLSLVMNAPAWGW